MMRSTTSSTRLTWRLVRSSNANITLPSGIGFELAGARYVRTAPDGHVGGEIWIHDEGIDLAASLAVIDQGGTRFPFSPRAVGVVHRRRPDPRPNPLRPRGSVRSGAGLRHRPDRQWRHGQPAESCAHRGQARSTSCSTLMSPASAAGGDSPCRPATVHLRRRAARHVHQRQRRQRAGPPVGTADLCPVASAGWPAPGNVPLYVPSLRISIPAVAHVATMATDVRVGLNASINTQTNHLVPSVQSTAVAPRFLRLGTSINMTTDPAADPAGIVAFVSERIREEVPGKVAASVVADRHPRPLVAPGDAGAAGAGPRETSAWARPAAVTWRCTSMSRRTPDAWR